MSSKRGSARKKTAPPPLPERGAMPAEGRARAVICAVAPQLEGGRFPVKRVEGEPLRVSADVFADGHEEVSCRLLHRRRDQPDWAHAPMRYLGNDRWEGRFTAGPPGDYLYTVEAWVDPLKTWLHDLRKRLEAGLELAQDLEIGAGLLLRAAAGAVEPDAGALRGWAQTLRADAAPPERARRALGPELEALAARCPERRFAARYGRELELQVERERARFGTWYEAFPRSFGGERGLRGLGGLLSYAAGMGFDVLYLPPVHPIGAINRKGKNNALRAAPGEPGSPWAIGSPRGGHKSVHPELGTLEDFRALVKEAAGHGLELALDIAFQCAPDHPYVREHPEWFRRRPDGSVQCAENPPKKYEDIYPFDFECEDWRGLWEELKSVFLFWLEQGVRLFRVDNPHTKPFAFWEWLIRELRRVDPGVILLAEAFTRPQPLRRLAKLGFSQSYNYFPWRNTKRELAEYFTELTRTEAREYLRPSLWPNTPDILTEYLQYGGRAAFAIRYFLAGTLGASCGIYGPAFELLESRPREQGMEEYLDSEKYELKSWSLEDPRSLREWIARVNRARRENPALQSDGSLRFHETDNPEVLCYSKRRGASLVLALACLDPRHAQAGWTALDLGAIGLDAERPFELEDLLTGGRYLWHGPRNYFELRPGEAPAHLFRVAGQAPTEEDFEPQP